MVPTNQKKSKKDERASFGFGLAAFSFEFCFTFTKSSGPSFWQKRDFLGGGLFDRNIIIFIIFITSVWQTTRKYGSFFCVFLFRFFPRPLVSGDWSRANDFSGVFDKTTKRRQKFLKHLENESNSTSQKKRRHRPRGGLWIRSSSRFETREEAFFIENDRRVVTFFRRREPTEFSRAKLFYSVSSIH